MVRRELTEHEIKEHAEAEEVMSKLEQTDAEDPEFGQLPPGPTLCTGSSAGQHDPAPGFGLIDRMRDAISGATPDRTRMSCSRGAAVGV
ncbi:MAG: hypothetical protein QOF25_1436 [Mycobacterium sp.]|nr:hypothetical protein [Mycobacterium sp.]